MRKTELFLLFSLMVTPAFAQEVPQEIIREITVALAPPPAQVQLEINEWTVPWPDTRPRDPELFSSSSSLAFFRV